MALENAEVLANLQTQLEQVQQQLEVGRNTILRLQGAIDVLTQIEDSKNEAPVDGGEVESDETQEGE